MGFIRDMQIKKTLKQQIQAERDKKAAGFDDFYKNKTKKKKSFIEAVKEEYAKGRKMVDDYQEGAAERDKAAAERYKKQTALLKEKTKLQKAKAEYKKAKGSGVSMFGGGSAFGGSSAPMFQGTIGSGGGNGYGASSWSIGGSMDAKPNKAPQKRKKRASKPKYKKVVYYR